MVGFAAKSPLGGEETLDADGTSRVDTARGDAHFGPKTKAKPIGEACGGVTEHTGAVNSLKENPGAVVILCDNALRMTTPEVGDVTNGLVNVRDNLDRHLPIAVFRFERVCGGEIEHSRSAWTPEDSNLVLLESAEYFDTSTILCDLFVKENTLHRVTRRRVVHLGVHHDAHGLVSVCMLVHVHMAYALRMTHHRDLRLSLDRRHKLTRPAWYDEINETV
mmetsp:Transcript_25650/g.55580  ORF Transcript_25650/g.55580 Transcript_25650/m.55580 type:complete len:220 (-) Transcript_25650:530-1189(-)